MVSPLRNLQIWWCERMFKWCYTCGRILRIAERQRVLNYSRENEPIGTRARCYPPSDDRADSDTEAVDAQQKHPFGLELAPPSMPTVNSVTAAVGAELDQSFGLRPESSRKYIRILPLPVDT